MGKKLTDRVTWVGKVDWELNTAMSCPRTAARVTTPT